MCGTRLPCFFCSLQYHWVCWIQWIQLQLFASQLQYEPNRCNTHITALYLRYDIGLVPTGALKTRGWKTGEIRRPKKKWNMLNDNRAWQDMTTGLYTVVFSSWRPWDTQWALTLKHCVPQRIAAAAAMRMRRHRRQRQWQTRHYDMILWLYNLVVGFCYYSMFFLCFHMFVWTDIVIIYFISRLQLRTSILEKRFHISFRPFQQRTGAFIYLRFR